MPHILHAQGAAFNFFKHWWPVLTLNITDKNRPHKVMVLGMICHVRPMGECILNCSSSVAVLLDPFRCSSVDNVCPPSNTLPLCPRSKSLYPMRSPSFKSVSHHVFLQSPDCRPFGAHGLPPLYYGSARRLRFDTIRNRGGAACPAGRAFALRQPPLAPPNLAATPHASATLVSLGLTARHRAGPAGSYGCASYAPRPFRRLEAGAWPRRWPMRLPLWDFLGVARRPTPVLSSPLSLVIRVVPRSTAVWTPQVCGSRCAPPPPIQPPRLWALRHKWWPQVSQRKKRDAIKANE